MTQQLKLLLGGQGGVATSQQLLDAGREFMFAKDFEKARALLIQTWWQVAELHCLNHHNACRLVKAADLLELVSERISKET